MAEHTIEKKLMTYSGLKKLEDELNNLKVNERRDIAQKIKEAREQGDLSENAEYDAAKDEQRDIEARIEEIENILKHVEVIADEDITTDVINLGTKVRVLEKEFDEEDEFSIVGTNEADSLKGKISNESPVGRALLGHKVGEEIMVETQAGILHYLVLGIERAEEYAGAAGA
jgi:transcription elongation factor GreA